MTGNFFQREEFVVDTGRIEGCFISLAKYNFWSEFTYLLCKETGVISGGQSDNPETVGKGTHYFESLPSDRTRGTKDGYFLY
jgi:hypothetical protein